MNHERAALRGLLAEAEQNRALLARNLETICDLLRRSLNTAITPLEDINYATLDALWQDFISKMAHRSGLELQINRLKRELGE